MCFFKQSVNDTYKTNLQQLKNFVMVKFTKDTVVQPIETGMLCLWMTQLLVDYIYLNT